jgi:hypothetical protein
MPYCHECPVEKQEECDKNYSEMKPLKCHMKERKMDNAKDQTEEKS